MIHVLVKRSGALVQLLHIEGHAQPARRVGSRYDLICAAVSTLANTLLEGFDLLEKEELVCVDKENNAVRILPQDDPQQQLFVEAVIRTLTDMEKEHGKFLEIHTMEV